MVNVTYIEHDGTRHEVEVEPGISLMEAAKKNNIQGILADCGGACACATCHVLIDEDWVLKLPKIAETEESMLEFGLDERDEQRSRLSCQIPVTVDLDGLVVHIPEDQV